MNQTSFLIPLEFNDGVTQYLSTSPADWTRETFFNFLSCNFKLHFGYEINFNEERKILEAHSFNVVDLLFDSQFIPNDIETLIPERLLYLAEVIDQLKKTALNKKQIDASSSQELRLAEQQFGQGIPIRDWSRERLASFLSQTFIFKSNAYDLAPTATLLYETNIDGNTLAISDIEKLIQEKNIQLHTAAISILKNMKYWLPKNRKNSLQNDYSHISIGIADHWVLSTNTFNPSKRPVMESAPTRRPTRRQRIAESPPEIIISPQPLPILAAIPAPTPAPIRPTVIPPAASQRKQMNYIFTSQSMLKGIFYIQLLIEEFPKWTKEDTFAFFSNNTFKIKLSASDFKEHNFTSEALILINNGYSGSKILSETPEKIFENFTIVGEEPSQAFIQLITWIQAAFKP